MKHEKRHGIPGVVLLIISAFIAVTCGTALSQPAHQGDLNKKRFELGTVESSIRGLEGLIKEIQQGFSDLVIMEQMWTNEPVGTVQSDYNLRLFDEKLKANPLFLAGGKVEIGNYGEFINYKELVKLQIGDYFRNGITIEILQADLERYKAERDRLQEEIAILEGQAPSQAPSEGTLGLPDTTNYPLEGRWLGPDMILIDVRYFPGQGYYGAIILEHKLKYFSKMQNTALFTVYPINDKPNVYQGTEYGYNDAGGQQDSPLVVIVSKDTMTYRNPDQTLTFIRQ
jgi:hypothetical protein